MFSVLQKEVKEMREEGMGGWWREGRRGMLHTYSHIHTHLYMHSNTTHTHTLEHTTQKEQLPGLTMANTGALGSPCATHGPQAPPGVTLSTTAYAPPNQKKVIGENNNFSGICDEIGAWRKQGDPLGHFQVPPPHSTPSLHAVPLYLYSAPLISLLLQHPHPCLLPSLCPSCPHITLLHAE